LTATVGHIEVRPGAGNVIPGFASSTLDVRHPLDAVRQGSVSKLLACAEEIARRRGLSVRHMQTSMQETVQMNEPLTQMLADAVGDMGCAPHRMFSGAGHDAMILAKHIPSAMLFLRSPGGISHSPEETVHADDVALALAVGRRFLEYV
jgi:allantoate deiminase